MKLSDISACLITRNEENDIRQCLESLNGVGEIIVIDAQSTDATVRLSREFNAKVSVTGWQGFSGAKNLAIGKAALPWVLSIDTDERLTEELREEIASLSGEYDGYYIPRQNFFLGRWIRRGGWYPDYTLRLFKNGRGHFPAARVHESVRLSGRAGYLKSPLRHYTYRTLDEYLERMDRYAALSAEDKIEKMSGKRTAGLFLKIILAPPSVFFKMYVLRRGFMDGFHGLVLASLYSFYGFLKYARIWEMTNERIS